MLLANIIWRMEEERFAVPAWTSLNFIEAFLSKNVVEAISSATCRTHNIYTVSLCYRMKRAEKLENAAATHRIYNI